MKNSLRLRLLKNKGSTLPGLLIGMIIIVLFVALIGPKIYGPVGESRETVCKQQIEAFSSALKMYKTDTTKYPTQEQGLESLVTQPLGITNWKGPYLKKKFIPKDPWGNNYIYTYPGEHGDYDIVSYGADGSSGRDGVDNDVASWE